MSSSTNAEIPAGDRYHEGQEHSHLSGDSSMSKKAASLFCLFCPQLANTGRTEDQRSIANRLAAQEKASEPGDDAETKLSKKDATLPVSFGLCSFFPTQTAADHPHTQAKMHGNEPSKGAKIDAELQAEEEATLKKKGDSLPGKK